jgi:hypothetical protein
VFVIRFYSGAIVAGRLSILMESGDDPARRREAAEMAQEVNVAISDLEARLDALLTGKHRVGFFCECGRVGIARVTLADYRRSSGAWIAGHEPN